VRRALLVLGITLAVLVGLVVWRADELGVSDFVDDLTADEPTPTGPAAVPPPPELDLPALPDPRPVAAARQERAVSPQAVRRALGRLAEDRRLGRRVSVAVSGLDGRPVLAEGPDVVTPASLLKVVTGTAALELIDPETRFATQVVRRGSRLTLVGGGDPLLTDVPDPDAVPQRADLATLARATARALPDRAGRVTLQYDDSLFAGPAVSPDWENDYIPDSVVSPITALWVDEGRDPSGTGARVVNPSRAAAVRFAELLGDEGVAVVGSPRPGRAPDGRPLASVAGTPVVEVVQHLVETSDNEAAEVMLRHVGLAAGGNGSFAAGADAVRSMLRDMGVGAAGSRVLDGSGLSRDNRLSVAGLLEVLAATVDADQPLLSGVATGLPVAGFTGSLIFRFDVDAGPGLGWVRAKTGTLTGVHGLAGTVTGRDGTPMLFVAVADKVRVPQTLFARARLDQIAAALAACRCAG
jgi:D-alanyl-D-alanine carboxypeptidase/D-alanyl-D-alanine-endopeptidase (penicillin-binding protein 4)